MFIPSAKTAVVLLSGSGVVAVPGKSQYSVRVIAYEIQSRNDAMTVQFRDGDTGPALGIRWTFNTREGTNTSGVMPPHFLFQTSPGNSLQAVITGTGSLDIGVRYFDDWI